VSFFGSREDQTEHHPVERTGGVSLNLRAIWASPKRFLSGCSSGGLDSWSQSFRNVLVGTVCSGETAHSVPESLQVFNVWKHRKLDKLQETIRSILNDYFAQRKDQPFLSLLVSTTPSKMPTLQQRISYRRIPLWDFFL